MPWSSYASGLGALVFDPATASLIQTLELQSQVDERFTNLQLLGAGAFSVVFSADDLVTRQRAAIKFLRPLVPQIDDYRARCFHREAEILWDLRGKRDIVTCLAPKSNFVFPVTFGAGFQADFPIPYYSMELGVESVADVIAKGNWEPELILMGFGAMCRSVQRIHAHGIVHRDLKPDNFIVMPRKEIKLADFGTARRLREGPLEADYKIWPGDRRHTAPEMFALVHDEDPKIAVVADIFSLGTILFEFFTGTKFGLQVFDQSYGEELASLMARVRKDERQRILDQLLPSIVDARPLPLISEFGSPVPGPIADRVDRLCRAIVDLDYRKRLKDFPSIFHQIDRSLFILRRRQAYLRLQEFRQRRREGRAARAAAVAARGINR